MLELLISIALALMVLYFAEVVLIRRHKVKPELSRKLVHVAHGLAVVSWPFFLQYKTIILLELVFFVCVIVARHARIFKSLDSVGRKTWGEIFFPLGVISVALLHPNKWIFAAAILHLALADAAAAIIGTTEKRHEYYVFGQRKTIEGSTAFWVVSLAVTAGLFLLAPLNFSHTASIVLLMPVAAALLENVGAYGTDNLIVPTFVALVLIRVQL